jgi:hypothetical protein
MWQVIVGASSVFYSGFGDGGENRKIDVDLPKEGGRVELD